MTIIIHDVAPLHIAACEMQMDRLKIAQQTACHWQIRFLDIQCNHSLSLAIFQRVNKTIICALFSTSAFRHMRRICCFTMPRLMPSIVAISIPVLPSMMSSAISICRGVQRDTKCLTCSGGMVSGSMLLHVQTTPPNHLSTAKHTGKSMRGGHNHVKTWPCSGGEVGLLPTNTIQNVSDMFGVNSIFSRKSVYPYALFTLFSD